MPELSMDRLAGDLKVCPGLARPHNLLSTRPDWVGALVQGKAASALPGLLASFFSLCGHAHRLGAELAVEAARGRAAPLTEAQRNTLRTETLREHLRRISLDWPQQLTGSDASRNRFQTRAVQALRACPLPLSAAVMNRESIFAALPPWLAQQVLGMSADSWLEGWERAPRAWMDEWCRSTPGWLPELLRHCKADADRVMRGAPALRVHATADDLSCIAAQLRAAPSFSRQPRWLGQCAETGPWTRLSQTDSEAFNSPWLRLGARLAELVRLSLPDGVDRSGAQWLQAGSLSIGEHEGLAWVEMARGLLIHHVQLDSNAPDARVAACQVVAPTEWNFHPQGAVAQVLEEMPKTITPAERRRILALMTAYDPCVSFDLVGHTEQAESLHA